MKTYVGFKDLLSKL